MTLHYVAFMLNMYSNSKYEKRMKIYSIIQYSMIDYSEDLKDNHT